jgi:ParB family chromosome partitioning protein
VESLIQKSRNGDPEKASVDQEVRSDYETLREHLSYYFGANVEFKRSNKGTGHIVIPFKSDEDLQRIVSILDKPAQ